MSIGTHKTAEVSYQGMTLDQCIAREGRAVDALKTFARDNRDLLLAIWGWGDGGGGGILEILSQELGAQTALEKAASRPKPAYAKVVIRPALRTQVFERDAYRCVTCGTHKNLTCDHKHPESKGGATTLENLQTMCKSCNSKKGVKA